MIFVDQRPYLLTLDLVICWDFLLLLLELPLKLQELLEENMQQNRFLVLADKFPLNRINSLQNFIQTLFECGTLYVFVLYDKLQQFDQVPGKLLVD